MFMPNSKRLIFAVPPTKRTPKAISHVTAVIAAIIHFALYISFIALSLWWVKQKLFIGGKIFNTLCI